MPKDFKDLEIWQEAYNLSILIYRLTDFFPKKEVLGITNQIRRSSVSVCANIAEGCGRYHQKDKIQLLIIARGSIYETRSHLSIAFGLNYLKKKDFEDIDKRYENLSKRLNAFIRYIKTINQLSS